MIRNFRDVGGSINSILEGNLLTSGMLYRGGALQERSQITDLPQIRTIINLRREPDPECTSAQHAQVAPREHMQNYVITSPVFHEWIQRLYTTVIDDAAWPLLLHCTAGKDRTGVAIALILKNLGIPDDTIVTERISLEVFAFC